MSSYSINSSEKTQKSGTEQETRTMLYLMGYREDSANIEFFLIDVFNDVTGVDDNKNVYWDSQSKGESTTSPSSLGKELVTLYKNYISEFNFDHYILSIRNISTKNLKVNCDNKGNVFSLSFKDFKDSAKNTIKKSLINECKAKTYIPSDEISDELIDKFLNVIEIVINNDKNSSYIKKISFMKDDVISDEVVDDIFNSIRLKQFGIKSSSNINGMILKYREDAFNLNRLISVESISVLILARILGYHIVDLTKHNSLIPFYFEDYFTKHCITDKFDKEAIANDAINEIYQMLCNKNLNKDFWDLLFAIMDECKKSKNNTYEIYRFLKEKHKDLAYLNISTEEAIIYIIACILGEKKI